MRAGGRLTEKEVEYRQARLPRSVFSGARLGGVGYLRQLVDDGAKVDPQLDGCFTVILADGARFEFGEETLIEALGMLVERFVEQEYQWLEAAGRVVVDVGANVGDSVVYFARRGAIHVYGFEPDVVTYNAALRNIELNHLDNVTVTRAAVTGPIGAAPAGSQEMSFADVLDQVRSSHPGVPIVCKIDCEGCEYSLFADSLQAESVDQVSQVMIEYHWRPPDSIEHKLESFGFQVDSEPAAAPGVGWIRARRS